ncbi:hypothetical protein N0V86_008790 [Didymella sp. IMI 355093]|nr:hypothetical protein N0V86_008790 [Didymella sp. IMI 355093]
MPNPKVVVAINTSAFICSTALVGISIGAIYLASDAYDVFTERFPPGSYGWSPSRWYGDDEAGWNIFINYNRSSEIKTYVAAAFALFVGLLGAFAFGLSFKPKVNIKKDTCWFEPRAREGHHYTCSIENSACNALRFSDEAHSPTNYPTAEENYAILDKACLQFRHARYMVIPLAVLSFLLVGLYGAHVWLARGERDGDEHAEARVRALEQGE